MKISLESQPAGRVDAEALIVPVFEGRPEPRFGAASLGGEVTGKALEMTLLHHVPGVSVDRVLLAGAGKPEKFTPAEQRNLAGAALRSLKSKSVTRVALALDPAFAGPEFAQAAVEGAILGNFDTDTYKTGEKKTVESFALVVGEAAAERDEALERAVERGRIIAEAQNSTRALVNEPGNKLAPLGIAAAARQVADEFGLEYEVLDREQMAGLGMRALLGVAQGSAEPPAMAVLRYRPAGAASKAHLGLVGKGVTFDSGGISIKPGDGMEKMKYDMAGAASAIGAMRAIAQLKPAIAVTAFMPCVENMPGGRAQRPGDIVAAMSGKTIEVINTDAEGRLILADALTYARSLGCTHLVDVATLTGAIVIALGHLRAGLFSSDDGLRDRVLSASQSAGERMWPMPLDEDYKEYLKSAFADLANVGGRYGGAVTAAIFLKEFAADTPWVHIDIAGTAWVDDEKPHLAKGPTGLPVRTLVRLATEWEE
jgi:leucyl aminopeptidase